MAGVWLTYPARKSLVVLLGFVIYKKIRQEKWFMKIAEIKEMTTNDLVERVEAETANYNQMVINHSISPLENPAQIKQLRRTIARMKTELRQRELNNK